MVFLKAHADKGFIEETIRSFPGIRDIRFISKEEALENVQKDAALSESLTLTGHNPFPDSFDIRWDPFFLRPDFLGHVTQKISALDGVGQVGYDKPRVQRLDVIQRVLHQLELALLGLLWSGAFVSAVLLGRLLFFIKSPLPQAYLLSSLGVGLAGAALGAVLSQRFVIHFSWRVLWAGPAIGLLTALIVHAFQEP
jgi:hypothetical protein